MATRANTNVSTAVPVGNVAPVAFNEDGIYVEFYRVESGTAGDTSVLVPSGYGSDIRAVMGNLAATDNLNMTQANTNVTLTYSAGAAGATHCVQLVCRRRT